MMRRSRLSGVAGNPLGKQKRLKSEKYYLGVTMVAPDQGYIDLYKNGKFHETIAEVTPLDVSEKDLDEMGRIKPHVFWELLQTYAKYVLQSKGVIPELPEKHQVFQGDYLYASVHPKVEGV